MSTRVSKSRKTTPRQAAAFPAFPAVVVGRLSGRDERGEPLVDYPGNPAPGPVSARAAVAWTSADIGLDVTLAFEGGSPAAPIILGLLRPPAAAGLPIELSADGQKLLLTAGQEIELRCGKASISLTSAGKVLIRGEYVLSRSAGVNRIKGAAVEIN